MKKHRPGLIGLLLVLLFASCEKMFIEGDKSSSSPSENFRHLWNEIDKKYAYFEEKEIDWEAIKTKYEPKIVESMSQDELFSVLGDLISELRDDHSNIISAKNVRSFQVAARTLPSYNKRTVNDYYIKDPITTTMVSGSLSHNFITHANVATNSIGYVRLNSFNGSFTNYTLSVIDNRFKNTKGLIVDLRGNGGGTVVEMVRLVSYFLEKDTTVYRSYLRSGKGHKDFSISDVKIDPAKTTYNSRKLVAVLIDRGSYSASSIFAIATKAIPNVALIGDVTGGGAGLPNGGQLPNGWIYRFSVSKMAPIAKPELTQWENGVPPEKQVVFDWLDLTKDEVLDAAIAYINSGVALEKNYTIVPIISHTQAQKIGSTQANP